MKLDNINIFCDLLNISTNLLTFQIFKIRHSLIDLQCKEDVCMAIFELRKRTRSKYLGTCSLGYLHFMKIVAECLLQLDPVKQRANGRGIV